MKKVEAIVNTSRFDDVVDRLRLIGVTGMTAAEAHELSPHLVSGGTFQGTPWITSGAPRYQITVVVDDGDVAAVVAAIRARAQTGSAGDGVITVSDVLEAIRVRTGELGVDAL